MKRIVLMACCLLLVCSAALAEENTVAGFVMESDAYRQMEDNFRETAFAGEMTSIDLTDTQTLLIVPEAAEAAMLPSLTVLIEQPVLLADDMDTMVQTVQSVLELMQSLQEAHPEAFLFHTEMAMAHAGTGLNFAVADQSLWLWADDATGLMLPIYLYDAQTEEMVGDVMLFSIMATGADKGYYALYTAAELVVDYLTHVEVSSGRSSFQTAVIQWYIESFVDGQALEQTP